MANFEHSATSIVTNDHAEKAPTSFSDGLKFDLKDFKNHDFKSGKIEDSKHLPSMTIEGLKKDEDGGKKVEDGGKKFDEGGKKADEGGKKFTGYKPESAEELSQIPTDKAERLFITPLENANGKNSTTSNQSNDSGFMAQPDHWSRDKQGNWELDHKPETMHVPDRLVPGKNGLQLEHQGQAMKI